MNKATIRALLAMALALAVAGGVQAQDQESGEVSSGSGGGSGVGSLRLYGGFHIGGGGNVRAKIDGHSAKSGMGVLGGFQLGAEYILHRFFSLGGEFRLTSTNPDKLPDNFLLVDLITVKPRGRYQFNGIPLEVYGTMPLGLSIVKPRNNADTKVNMNYGLGAGATYFFTQNMGVNSEMLGIWHWFRESATDQFGVSTTVKNRIAQFYFFANFVYVL